MTAETITDTTLPAVDDLRFGPAEESRQIDWRHEYNEDEGGEGWRYAEVFEFEHGGETYTLVTDNSGASATHLVHGGEVYHLEDDEGEITDPEGDVKMSEDVLEALRGAEPSQYGAEGPMMNYWYPTVGLSFDADTAAVLAHYPLCVVEIGEETGLALTGGGMDLSWEIAEAFVALGYFPPAFLRSLPGMSGYRGPNRVRVVEAMIARDRRALDSLQYDIDRLEALIPRLQSPSGL